MVGVTTYLTERMRAGARRDEGATMVEYAFMVAVIALVALAGAQLLGLNLLGLFNDAAAEF